MKNIFWVMGLLLIGEAAFALEVKEIKATEIASFMMDALQASFNESHTSVVKDPAGDHLGNSFILKDRVDGLVIACKNQPMGEFLPTIVVTCQLNLKQKITGTSIADFLFSALENDFGKDYSNVIRIPHRDGFILKDRVDSSVLTCFQQSVGELTPAFMTVCEFQFKNLSIKHLRTKIDQSGKSTYAD